MWVPAVMLASRPWARRRHGGWPSRVVGRRHIARWRTWLSLRSAPTNANSSPPPSTSTRPTDFSVAKHFHATKRLTLAIVPQHRAASHTPSALNCLLRCCLLRVFMLVLLVPCILPASFCTLEYATQKFQTLTYTCHRSFHLQRSRTLICKRDTA